MLPLFSKGSKGENNMLPRTWNTIQREKIRAKAQVHLHSSEPRHTGRRGRTCRQRCHSYERCASPSCHQLDRDRRTGICFSGCIQGCYKTSCFCCKSYRGKTSLVRGLCLVHKSSYLFAFPGWSSSWCNGTFRALSLGLRV